MKPEISYEYEEREMLSEERERAMWLEQLAAETLSKIRNQRKEQDEESNTVTDVN